MEEEDYASEGERIYFLTNEQAKAMEDFWESMKKRTLEKIAHSEILPIEELKKRYGIR